jgi:LysR family transcriptional regulator (chromosome initiation inhibitor)
MCRRSGDASSEGQATLIWSNAVEEYEILIDHLPCSLARVTFDAHAVIGQVIGCIGTRSQPMRGCCAELPGSMRYQLVASPAFQQRWFAKGLTRAAARKAPVFAYSRKDTLQSDFMQSRFGLTADAHPTHYLSLPQARLKAMRRGLGYGMVPHMLVSDLLKSREQVDVAPNHFTDVKLYWHAWELQSPRMEMLSERAVHAARRILSSKEPVKRSTMPKQ